jgi:hypothetical protein
MSVTIPFRIDRSTLRWFMTPEGHATAGWLGVVLGLLGIALALSD